MMLSQYFDSTEFSCKCGCGFGLSPGTVDHGLLIVLEFIRAHFDAPVYVNDFGGSGCRCVAHNKAIGGSRNSQHLIGRAADIKVKGVAPDVVADFCETIPAIASGGMGRYNTFTHIDTRGHRARWDRRVEE